MQIKEFSRRRLWIGALVASLGVGAIASCSRSHGYRWSHGHHATYETPEAAHEELQSHLKWVLRAIDADQDQKQQIQSIGGDAVVQLFPLIQTHHEHHRELVEALMADNVDRDELHRLRQAEMVIADSASKGVVDALADMAAVLNDTQRAELREHLARHTQHGDRQL